MKTNNDAETYLRCMKFIKIEGYKEGTNIIEEGDDGDRFYVIIQGFVNVMKSQVKHLDNFDIKMNPNE